MVTDIVTQGVIREGERFTMESMAISIVWMQTNHENMVSGFPWANRNAGKEVWSFAYAKVM